MLSAVAKETKAALPDILNQLPEIDAAQSTVHKLDDLAALQPSKCPGFTLANGSIGFTSEVVNDDTLDTAISLSKESATSDARVVILNLASERSPGGGWLGGALAQEESICYRSSLAFSLHRRYYPLGDTSAIYTPHCVIIRDAFGAGHELIKNRPADELDVVGVISVAAIRRPETSRAQKISGGEIAERDIFAKAADRDLTKAKMRLTLRVAAAEGHTKLVLGALGCGAFRNPTEDVALCWREVLGEDEFRGWFERIVFAVLDKGSDGNNAGRAGVGNFGMFATILGGKDFTGASAAIVGP